MGRDIDGRALAVRMLQETKRQVDELRASGWAPRLVSLQIGSYPAVELYIRNQRRQAERLGIIFDQERFAADITEQELDAAIYRLNSDPRVTGIFLQRPVPKRFSIKTLQAAVHPLKDVEGMHPASIGNIVYRQLDLGPCTAVAALELLKSTGVELEGLEATIIGHSEIVGKPIAFLLMAEGATVTVCHHLTREVSEHSRRADAVFVAVGKPGLIRGDMLKPGCVLIDIGINQVPGPSGNPQVVGDCDYLSCKETAGWITPVPGGVGPVTVAVLMRNTVVALRCQKVHYEAKYGSCQLSMAAAGTAEAAVESAVQNG